MSRPPKFVPLSVRASRRGQLRWRLKLLREGLALWLAPWLRLTPTQGRIDMRIQCFTREEIARLEVQDRKVADSMVRRGAL